MIVDHSDESRITFTVIGVVIVASMGLCLVEGPDEGMLVLSGIEE